MSDPRRGRAILSIQQTPHDRPPRSGRRAGKRTEQRANKREGISTFAAIGAAQFGAAWFASSSVSAATMVVGGTGAIVACFIWPVAILVTAFPASFATWRVGPAAIDMSIADVFTILGTLAALPFVPWASRSFRRLLTIMVAYSAVVVVSVAGNPSVAGAVEVAHRFVLVMGTVAIGAAVVRTGATKWALRILVGAACAISLFAVVDTIGNNLKPAYPLGIHKNASGFLLVATLLVLWLGAPSLKLTRWQTAASAAVVAAGIMATQSRGAGVALVLSFFVYAARNLWVRDRRLIRLAPLLALLALVIGFAMYTSFQTDVDSHQGANYKYGPVGSRTSTYSVVWSEVIKPSPVIGAGPKWFTRPGAPAGEPHNFIIGELASGGVVGLVALGVVVWTCLSVANKTRSHLGVLAWYVLLARLIADLFDLFWVAGPNTLPFLILGLAVGASSLEDDRSAKPTAITTISSMTR